ncbi:hypothetical protein GMRT_12052 [Giardia muris]|uniref:Uncharacterized protein n=1 Tax=Giardia muris TaxID=5742 RepID=A0A4Z1SPI9_GIAMU|nr:hypothetical protein GMRT_12052 [Giardia muris]|eukprot:TNJ27706.1 hypothetical protein GMRT_12052 [Giardia muris]
MFSLPFTNNVQACPEDTHCQYCGRCLPAGASVRLCDARPFCPAHTQTTAYTITADACSFGNFALTYDDAGFVVAFDSDVLLEPHGDVGVVSRMPVTALDEHRLFFFEVLHAANAVEQVVEPLDEAATGTVAGTAGEGVADWLRYRAGRGRAKYSLHVSFPSQERLRACAERGEAIPMRPLTFEPPPRAMWSARLRDTREKVPRESLPVFYVYGEATGCQLSTRWPIYLATPAAGVGLPGLPFMAIHVYCAYVGPGFQPLQSPTTKTHVLRADLARYLLRTTYPPTGAITEEFSVIISKYLCQVATRVVYPYKYRPSALSEEAAVAFFRNTRAKRHRAHVLGRRRREGKEGAEGAEGPAGFEDYGVFPTGSEILLYLIGGMRTQSYNQRREKSTTSYLRSYICLNQYISSYAAERLRLHRLTTLNPDLLSRLSSELSVTPSEMRQLTSALVSPTQVIVGKVFFEAYRKAGGGNAPFQMQSWSTETNFLHLNVELLRADGSRIEGVLDACDRDEVLPGLKDEPDPYAVVITSVLDLATLYDRLFSDEEGGGGAAVPSGPLSASLGGGPVAGASSGTGCGSGTGGGPVASPLGGPPGGTLPNDDDEAVAVGDTQKIFSGLIGHCSLRPVYPNAWLAFRASLPKPSYLEELLISHASPPRSMISAVSRFVRGSSDEPFHASISLRGVRRPTTLSLSAISLADDAFLAGVTSAGAGNALLCPMLSEVLEGAGDSASGAPGEKRYAYPLVQSVYGDALDRLFPQDYGRALYNGEQAAPGGRTEVVLSATDRRSNFRLDEHIAHSVCADFGEYVDLELVRQLIDGNRESLCARLGAAAAPLQSDGK